jgi:FtsP/CotA-like multicopper oxidase with cupredoxin domain
MAPPLLLSLGERRQADLLMTASIVELPEIAVVADNPGNWMLHCHVLEHQVTGMMAVVRVA